MCARVVCVCLCVCASTCVCAEIKECVPVCLCTRKSDRDKEKESDKERERGRGRERGKDLSSHLSPLLPCIVLSASVLPLLRSLSISGVRESGGERGREGSPPLNISDTHRLTPYRAHNNGLHTHTHAHILHTYSHTTAALPCCESRPVFNTDCVLGCK